MAHPVRMLLAATVAALTALGCGGDGIPRVPVSGSVTLDGQPLSQGQITFLPEQGDNVVAGAIEDGRYDIPRREGPSPGMHRVMIYSKVPTGKQVVADPMNPQDGMVDEMREGIPDRYNAQSELTADVPQGGDDFDFQLASDGDS